MTLPANAACDGDTVTDGYHVFSYLVPQGTDPTWESFKTGFPSSGYGIPHRNGNYYGKVNTAATTGQIIGIPGNNWSSRRCSPRSCPRHPALQQWQLQRRLGSRHRLCQLERDA